MITVTCALIVLAVAVLALAFVVYRLSSRLAYLQLDEDSQDHDITDHNARINDLAALWDKKFEAQQLKWDEHVTKLRDEVVSKTLMTKTNNHKVYR